jgi:hypothetical protein
MRSLEYRSPRVEVEFRVDFVAGAGIFRGTCINISDKGVRARFERPVPLSLVGSLVMHHPHCKTTIRARAVYLQKDQVGLAFVDHSMRNQEALDYFMGVLASK